MKRFEYDRTHVIDDMEIIDKKGLAGWELVAVAEPQPGISRMYWKRELPAIEGGGGPA